MNPEHEKASAGRTIIFLLITVVVVFAVYGQVATHEFVLYDDPVYVSENPTVLAGLSMDNLRWAFTTLSMANWHPVTWLSYLLDIQLFGPNAGAMLLENVALHALNTILLFILLKRLTGFFWRSAAVAALFALHPLHVESVAWISERKDVLSSFFWLLTLYFHIRYTEHRTIRFYLLALASFAFGLMAKPMLVSLPVIMLLIDYWPLERMAPAENNSQKNVTLRWLIIEKFPFLVLAAVSCWITVIAQSGAMTSMVVSSLANRISNSLVSYVAYLGKMFWPISLSPFYPFPDAIPLWQPVASAILLAIITLLSFRERTRRPYLIVGWLWFLITLVPVIGLVRVGMHAIADRYTYVPLTGIFIMIVWGIADLCQARFTSPKPLAIATATILAVLSFLSWRQASYWKDSATLFSHAHMVTGNNHVASNILGINQMKKGNNEAALRLFDQSIHEASWFIEPYIHKANLLKKLERNEESIQVFNQAMILNPYNATIYIDLGNLHATQGRMDEAVESLLLGLRIDPRSPSAHYNLGLALHFLGRLEEAEKHYNQALLYGPGLSDAHNNLGITLAELGRVDEAIVHFREALRLKPDYMEAQKNLEYAMGIKNRNLHD